MQQLLVALPDLQPEAERGREVSKPNKPKPGSNNPKPSWPGTPYGGGKR